MFVQYTTADAVLAVVGFVGILSTAVISVYAFKRNRMGNRRWQ